MVMGEILAPQKSSTNNKLDNGQPDNSNIIRVGCGSDIEWADQLRLTSMNVDTTHT